MFVSRNVWMVLSKATMKNVEDDKGVLHRMAECQLVIDELQWELAQELGESVAGHLFTPEGAIRHELATITLDPRVPNQRMTVTAAVDMSGTEISDVEIVAMTCARQEDDKTGKEWIKATVRVLFDLAPRVHREWLVMHFGNGLHFSFEAEQGDLFDQSAAGVSGALRNLQRLAGEDGSMTLTGPDGDGIHITKDDVRPVRGGRKKGAQ